VKVMVAEGGSVVAAARQAEGHAQGRQRRPTPAPRQIPYANEHVTAGRRCSLRLMKEKRVAPAGFAAARRKAKAANVQAVAQAAVARQKGARHVHQHAAEFHEGEVQGR